MTSDFERVFTEQELLDAGRLTVDLIAEQVQAGQGDEANALVQRFQLELMTMFYSYTGWEFNILQCIEQLGGAEHREQALSQMENYAVAPERDVVTKGREKVWIAELKAITQLIDEAGNTAGVAKRLQALRTEALELHDSVMSRVTALLSYVYESFGAEKLQWVYGEVMKPEAMDPDGKIPFREKVENIIQFMRSHLLPFRIWEDFEKVTFNPDPCPSGARLIRSGHYDSPRDNAIVREPGPITYGRKEMPVYCCHEPAMELTSALRTGVPLFIVDPPEDIGISACKVYVYKQAHDIPPKYYERLGLKKPDDLIVASR